MNTILQQIAGNEDLELLDFRSLSGGDINEVFLLKSTSGNLVVKLNSKDRFPGMFEAEAKGLDLLRLSKSFRIPEIISTAEIDAHSYLLLKYIETAPSAGLNSLVFAQKLVQLHKTTDQQFGLHHHNYIGSLPQYNHREKTALEFYIAQRLEPQFEMALRGGYQFRNKDQFYKALDGLIPDEPPSLVHGDLWAGNFLLASNEEPVLIDPAVAYAPREMDIGMMHLFGGFPPALFEQYDDIFPMQEGWRERVPIWQLYYLLVHLNLFGRGYLNQVENIVDRYS